MRRSPIVILSFALAAVVALVLASSASRGEEPSKPTRFSGYLLDSAGLDERSKEDVRRETFESPGVSWRYLYQDGEVKICAHKRVETEAHSGERSEFVQYEVKRPGVVVFGHYVDYPSAFKEADPAVWVRSDKPGVSFAALVVFPKTLRPDTNEPLTAIVPGASYQNPGEWRRLDFPQGLDKALEDVAQAIRGEHKIPVSCDCAYVRQILLVSEARNGRYSLWVDDIEIDEHIRPEFELLRESERGARFNPINLLSARLQLSQAPIFWQDEFSESDGYGLEPFGLDLEKVAKSKKKQLVFLDGVKPRADEKKNARLAVEDGVGTAINAEKRSGAEQLWARLVDKPRAQVGQAGFNESGPSTERVASASFDEPAAREEEARRGEFLALRPDDELISGSATLSDARDAATDTFVKKDERFDADVKLEGDKLVLDGEWAYLVSAIRYQGEPLAFLKKLGFNAAWLSEAPTEALLKEAVAEKMWLISPVPRGFETVFDPADGGKSDDDAAPFGNRKISAAYNPVLMWRLGEGMTQEDADVAREKIKKVRSLDSDHPSRPYIGSVRSGLGSLTQNDGLNVVLLDRAPLQTSLDLNAYGEWLRGYRHYAVDQRTVFWNKIQTEPSALANRQRQFLGMLDDSPGLVSYEQMRQMVRFAMRAECRGLLFESSSRLDAKDHKTIYRAKALEALNLELLMITPWFASGKPDKSLLESSSPGLSGIAMRAARSVLVAPISTLPNNQYVMGADAVRDWSAKVVASDGYEPDLLTPGALRKIASKRSAGGRFFTLEDGSMNSLVFLTQSEPLVAKLLERAPNLGKRMATLAVELARMRIDLYEQTVYRLKYVEEHGVFPISAPPPPPLGETVDKAEAALDAAEVFIRRRDYSQAYLEAEKATREIREREREFWTLATRAENARPVTPLSASFYDMPAYLEFYEKLMSKKVVPSDVNMIDRGDMQSPISTMQANGWSFKLLDSATFQGSFEIASDGANSNGDALRLKIEPKGVDASKTSSSADFPAVPDGPSIEIEKSFPPPGSEGIRCGQIVCFQGRVKIPRDLTNTVDGLMIYDDQGGEALAVRFVKKTSSPANESGWKSFAFYRLATRDGQMRVRISLSGLGEVWLDDLAARVVE